MIHEINWKELCEDIVERIFKEENLIKDVQERSKGYSCSIKDDEYLGIKFEIPEVHIWYNSSKNKGKDLKKISKRLAEEIDDAYSCLEIYIIQN